MACKFKCLFKPEDFLRSQAVTYTVNVVTVANGTRYESLLLQTSNRKWHITYQIVEILMTLSDLQGYLPTAFSVMLCSS